MVTITIAIIAMSLTITAFCFRRIIVYPATGASFAWLLLAGNAWLEQTTPGFTDSYFYLFLFAIAMTITMPIAAWEL